MEKESTPRMGFALGASRLRPRLAVPRSLRALGAKEAVLSAELSRLYRASEVIGCVNELFQILHEFHKYFVVPVSALFSSSPKVF